MKHTFLFTEGNWSAKGMFFDKNSRPVKAKGRTVVSHMKDMWTIDSYIELKDNLGTKYTNKYEVFPFTENKDATLWKSVHLGLGTLIGKFVVAEDTLLCCYSATGESYNGGESMIKINDDHYKSRGCLFKGDKKISSWAMDLILEK